MAVPGLRAKALSREVHFPRRGYRVRAEERRVLVVRRVSGRLVIGDRLYIHSPFPNKVFAISLADQQIKWKYEPRQDPTVIPVMCCDTVNRGVAYADGKIFLQQADTNLVALDAKTGKEVWKVKNGDPKKGETNTNAPHVFKDKVITGISGGEFGVRGFLAAYDIKSGRQVWKAYSTGPDAEMLMDPDKTMTWTDGKMAPVGRDSSLKTWQGDQWKIGGGTTWGDRKSKRLNSS